MAAYAWRTRDEEKGDKNRGERAASQSVRKFIKKCGTFLQGDGDGRLGAAAAQRSKQGKVRTGQEWLSGRIDGSTLKAA